MPVDRSARLFVWIVARRAAREEQPGPAAVA